MYKKLIVFGVLFVVVMEVCAAKQSDTDGVASSSDVVLLADDELVNYIVVDDNAENKENETSGNLFSLTRNNSDDLSDNKNVIFWVE